MVVAQTFVRSEINGHVIKTFVDSGAANSYISPSWAELYGLTDLIDFSVTANSISMFGCSTTEGLIRKCAINVADTNLKIDLIVDKSMTYELLIGADFLKYNSCVLDYSQNEMRIGSSKTKLIICEYLRFKDWICRFWGVCQALLDDGTDLTQNTEDISWTIKETNLLHRVAKLPDSRIKCIINGVPCIHALVDTGCARSTMYRSTAEKCGLMDKLDTSKIVTLCSMHGEKDSMGTISGFDIQIGNVFYPMICDVSDIKSISDAHMIIGHDFMRKNNCVLDYEKNKLFISTRHMTTAQDKSATVTTDGAPSSQCSTFIDASKQNLLMCVKEAIVRETMNL